MTHDPVPCPSCGTALEYDPVTRGWFCWLCGRLYRLATVVNRAGYAPSDRWMVGAEDGDDA